MSRILLLGFSLFLFSDFGLCSEEEIFDLNKIEVLAWKDLSVFNFGNQSLISEVQLELSTTGQVVRQFVDLPGVITVQNGGPGGRVSFFMRGTESRHVAFTLDGLRVNDPSNTDRQFDAAFFSSPALKSVRVYQGPQSVLFGADSMGGLIELVTRKGEDAPETRVNFNGGSFGTIDTSISTDWTTQKGSQGTLTGYRFHTDGLSRLNRKRFNATERDSADMTQLTSSSRHQWNPKIQSDILFSFLRGENELDGSQDDNDHDTTKNDQYVVQQKTNYSFSSTKAVSLRTGANRHQRSVNTLVLGKESYTGDLVQNEALYRAEYKNLDLLLGLTSEHEEFSVPMIKRSFDVHSLFAQSAFHLRNFKFQAGARSERHIRYGSFFTASGGISYLFRNQVIKAQFSQGYKAPSLYQLYAPSLFGGPIGNSQLTPELNNSFEGTWSLSEDSFEAGATFFQNRLSNLITFTTAQGYINQSHFVTEGIEVSGKIKQDRFQLYSSLTSQVFKQNQSTVLRRPLNSLNAGFAYFPTDSLEIALKGRWFSSRKDLSPASKTVKLNGYEVVDLGFKYNLQELDLGFELLNILDRSYEDLYGYSVMPRSIFFHVGFKF